MNRQFGFYVKQKTAMKNNLIGILDQTFPGANTYFDSPARNDGSQKWVDFIDTYWHVDCIRNMSLNVFTEHYKKWCKRKKYNYSQSKAVEIYEKAKEVSCPPPSRSAKAPPRHRRGRKCCDSPPEYPREASPKAPRRHRPQSRERRSASGGCNT